MQINQTKFKHDISKINITKESKYRIYNAILVKNTRKILPLNFRYSYILLILLLIVSVSTAAALALPKVLSNHTFTTEKDSSIITGTVDSPFSISIHSDDLTKQTSYTYDNIENLLDVKVLKSSKMDLSKQFSAIYDTNEDGMVTTLSFKSTQVLSDNDVFESTYSIGIVTEHFFDNPSSLIKYNDSNYEQYYIKSLDTSSIIFDISGKSDHVISKIIIFDYDNISYTLFILAKKDILPAIYDYLESFSY